MASEQDKEKWEILLGDAESLLQEDSAEFRP